MAEVYAGNEAVDEVQENIQEDAGNIVESDKPNADNVENDSTNNVKNGQPAATNNVLTNIGIGLAVIGAAGAVGAVGGVAAVAYGAYAVGLSSTGPVAGGLFAANMGAGLAAGSVMSILLSLVMAGAINIV